MTHHNVARRTADRPIAALRYIAMVSGGDLLQPGEETFPPGPEVIVGIHRSCDGEGPTVDLRSPHQPEMAGIKALIPVVAHEEVLALGDCDGPERSQSACSRGDHHCVLMTVEVLGGENPVVALRVEGDDEIGIDWGVGDRFGIDDQSIVAHGDGVARETDDSFDQPLAVGG